MWDPDDSAYVLSPDTYFQDDGDSDWSTRDTEDDGTLSDTEDPDIHHPLEDGYESDDMVWCTTAAKLQTWEIDVDLGTKVSKRQKYQLMPLIL